MNSTKEHNSKLGVILINCKSLNKIGISKYTFLTTIIFILSTIIVCEEESKANVKIKVSKKQFTNENFEDEIKSKSNGELFSESYIARKIAMKNLYKLSNSLNSFESANKNLLTGYDTIDLINSYDQHFRYIGGRLLEQVKFDNKRNLSDRSTKLERVVFEESNSTVTYYQPQTLYITLSGKLKNKTVNIIPSYLTNDTSTISVSEAKSGIKDLSDQIANITSNNITVNNTNTTIVKEVEKIVTDFIDKVSNIDTKEVAATNNSLNFSSEYFGVQVTNDKESAEIKMINFAKQAGLSIVDFKQCEDVVKKALNITTIGIKQIDIKSAALTSTSVSNKSLEFYDTSYYMFNPMNGEAINITQYCSNKTIVIKQPTNQEVVNITLYNEVKAQNNESNVFNTSDAYYEDRCFIFIDKNNSNSNANVPLSTRKKNAPNITIACSDGCIFEGFDESNYTICNCSVSSAFANTSDNSNGTITNQTNTTDFSLTDLLNQGVGNTVNQIKNQLDIFGSLVSSWTNSNIDVFLCYKQAFDPKKIGINAGFYYGLIMTGVTILSIWLIIKYTPTKAINYLHLTEIDRIIFCPLIDQSSMNDLVTANILPANYNDANRVIQANNNNQNLPEDYNSPRSVGDPNNVDKVNNLEKDNNGIKEKVGNLYRNLTNRILSKKSPNTRVKVKSVEYKNNFYDNSIITVEDQSRHTFSNNENKSDYYSKCQYESLQQLKSVKEVEMNEIENDSLQIKISNNNKNYNNTPKLVGANKSFVNNPIYTDDFKSNNERLNSAVNNDSSNKSSLYNSEIENNSVTNSDNPQEEVKKRLEKRKTTIKDTEMKLDKARKKISKLFYK